jgi:hypothetical protein
MACGGCGRRHQANVVQRQSSDDQNLMGGYANLTDQQIKTRLEVYKRRYCAACDKRYACDFGNYLTCRKSKQGG